MELSDNPDRVLAEQGVVVATADAWVLDRAGTWADLPALAAPADAWIVDLSGSERRDGLGALTPAAFSSPGVALPSARPPEGRR